MGLSKLSEACKKCPNVDSCDHKRMEALGCLPSPEPSKAAEIMRRHFHTASVRIGRWHVLLAQTFLRAMTSVPLPSFSLYPMVLLE